MKAIAPIALAGTLGLFACDDATDVKPVAALRLVDQPSALTAGQTFDLTVELLDASSRRTSESGRPVTLTAGNDVRLSGPVTVNARGGIATFKNLAITSAADALTMTATSGSFSETSATFTVHAGAVSAARSSFFPDSIVFIAGVATPIDFTFTDAYGNPIAGRSVALTSSRAGTTLTPAAGTTDDDGVFHTSFSTTTSGSTTFSANIDGAGISLGSHLATTEFCASLPLSIPGSVTGTLPVPPCDVQGHESAVYRFTKSGSGGVSFRTTSGFSSRVEVKTSLLEPNVAVQPTASSPTAEWLLPDGSYLFRITTLSSNGSYTITTTPITGTTGVTTRLLAAPGTYSGQTLTVNDRQFGDGTVFDYFVIYSNRSCTITMRSADFDSVIWIENAIQLVFAGFNDNGAGGKDARVTKSQCNDLGDPIGIYANSNLTPSGGTATGAYTLTIEFGPPVPASPSSPPALIALTSAPRDLSEFLRVKRDMVRKQ